MLTPATQAVTPAIYRTRITHARHSPVHHSFEYRSYSWYVDVDDLPRLPWWLRPFARLHADDHFAHPPHGSLRERLNAFLADRDVVVPEGRITALLQARVLGYVFNPLSVFWCHDDEGTLRHVIAEVHNTHGERHAYLLPPADLPVVTAKKFYVSPFNQVEGYYLVQAPRPDSQVDITVALHRDRRPAFVANLRGERRPATTREVAILQIISPLAPLLVAVRIRIQGIKLWLRRVPVEPHRFSGNLRIIRKPSAAIDSRRWPAVAKVPSGPLCTASGVVAARLLLRVAARLPLRLVYPDGSVIGAADPTAPTMVIHQPDALARRIGRHGLIGFGESYMAGEWSCEESPQDLTPLLVVFGRSVADLVPRSLQWLRPIAPAFRPRWRSTSREQTRRNIAQHYDLSNELFAEFLDETMTYSCALFDELAPRTPNWTDLAAAQRRKIDRLLDLAGVQRGSRVLEIGTGWGELCIRAATRGAHVRSVTLSAEQQHLARLRVAAAGLSESVQIDLCDYRDVGGCDGAYDAIVSVEMIEAVGYHAWPRYFTALERLVRPGGRVAIQAITMPHERMLASRNTHTWIQKYIFPGGLLPSTRAIVDITERHTGLRIVDMTSLRPHYAETLRLWRERFTQRREMLVHLGFDEVFGRMWELYLAYSEAGFRSGYLDVCQWTFAREGIP